MNQTSWITGQYSLNRQSRACSGKSDEDGGNPQNQGICGTIERREQVKINNKDSFSFKYWIHPKLALAKMGKY